MGRAPINVKREDLRNELLEITSGGKQAGNLVQRLLLNRDDLIEGQVLVLAMLGVALLLKLVSRAVGQGSH